MTSSSSADTPATEPFSAGRPLRVAVIGSGPSGMFAAEALLRQGDFPAEIDVYDRLPTPYGLVRYGVAPDHLTIKSVTKGFEKTLSDPRVQFFGHVEFGRDLSREDLHELYDAVIYTVGASSDRRLGIPGEDLRGSMSATEFVAWYNGHPDAADRDLSLDAEGVAVIGVGNVALDVSRILAKTVSELRASDIAPHALAALERSAVKDIYILGRRGPAQAAFTTKELREFGELADADPVVRPAEVQLREEEEAQVTDQVKRKNLEVLRELAVKTPEGKARRVHLRFLTSPVELIDDGEGRVGGLRVERNRLDEQGSAVGTGEFETLPVQLVLRSVGYRGVPLPGVPFDERRGVIANEEGRVTGCPGEYTAGWIKRGPSGVVGTNRKDATDTVALLLADAAAGRLLSPAQPTREAVWERLRARGADVYTLADWRALDAHELAQGQAQGRPRHKLARREEMLRVRGSS